MFLRCALSHLRTATRHLSQSERYRLWPLYAGLLAGFMHSSWLWPYDMAMFDISLEHKWIYWMDYYCWNWGLYLCYGLGLIGLFRSSWLARGSSLYALWFADQYMFIFHGLFDTLQSNIVLYTFGLPSEWIESVAGEGTQSAMLLWCVYLTCVWLALRPLLKRGYKKIPQLEARILKRWPKAARWAHPVV